MTLREIHERCKARHRQIYHDQTYCSVCGTTWPCPDYEDAVAALAIVDRLVDGVIAEFIAQKYDPPVSP